MLATGGWRCSGIASNAFKERHSGGGLQTLPRGVSCSAVAVTDTKVTAQLREKGYSGWCSCLAPGALDKEKGITVVVPKTLQRDLLSFFRNASITPKLAIVSLSRRKLAENKYFKACLRRHYTDKFCCAQWVDPRSPDARSKVCWSWITGKETPPTERCSPMTMSVVWRTAALYRLCRRSPGKPLRRPEQVECTLHSVDDSAGISNLALDVYDVGCSLGRECMIQKSLGGEEPCLFNWWSCFSLYIILATTTWTISVQYRKPPRSYRKIWTSPGPGLNNYVLHSGWNASNNWLYNSIQKEGNPGFWYNYSRNWFTPINRILLNSRSCFRISMNYLKINSRDPDPPRLQ